MRVIGTAGHVDHGKSTLVKRLTNIDPDRLAEEKAREMTIDLGFAWLELGDDTLVGIVDVPGHRDFIENMLAGIGGIDAVLLVIAADEGVMPQTREHLAILHLLGIENGIIAMTKTDMIDDPEWLELVEQDIVDGLAGTSLANIEIVRVSAMTSDGIPHLLERLESLLIELPQRTDYNQPRLPIDRVFTISGFGTVVTGTLLGGALRTGDEIELQPTGLRGRVRGLQSYKQSVDIAYPGSRVAVNVSGVEKRAVSRGHVLSHPGQVQPTRLVDVYFHHLPDASRPLKHNAQVKVFSGAAEATAHVRLLNNDVVPPGSQGWLQLRLDEQLPISRGDRYIIRYPSPAETIGGGTVVEPHPRKRWKRFNPHTISQLGTLMQGTPGQRIAQAAEGNEPIKLPNLQKQVGYSDTELEIAIQEALADNLLIELSRGLYVAMSSYTALQRTILDLLTSFHAAEPLRLGMPREEMRSRVGVKNQTLTLLIDTLEDQIVSEDNLLRLSNHQVRFTERQETQIKELMHAMQDAPYTPPSYADAVQIVDEKVLRALIDLGDIIQVKPEVIFARTAYEEMVDGVLQIIDRIGNIDAKSLRDRFNTSRKYAIALLEHLDSIGVTRRVGDERVRGKNAPA